MDRELQKQALIRANKYKLSCRKFLMECEQYGIEIDSREFMDFSEAINLFSCISKRNYEERRFEPDEIMAVFDLVKHRLNICDKDTITVFIGDCVLLEGVNTFPACLKISFEKVSEYFRCKTNDTIGAELMLVKNRCAVGLLNEFDEHDNEKIFVILKRF